MNKTMRVNQATVSFQKQLPPNKTAYINDAKNDWKNICNRIFKKLLSLIGFRWEANPPLPIAPKSYCGSQHYEEYLNNTLSYFNGKPKDTPSIAHERAPDFHDTVDDFM